MKNTLPQDDRLGELLSLARGLDQRMQGMERWMQGIEQRAQGVEARLGELQTRVDQRLMETRPIWEAVLTRLDKIEGRLDKIEGRLDRSDERLESIEKDVRVIRDQVEDAILQVADTRGRQRDHERRLKALEHDSPVKASLSLSFREANPLAVGVAPNLSKVTGLQSGSHRNPKQ